MAEQQFFPSQNMTGNPPPIRSNLMVRGSKKPVLVPYQVSPPSYIYGSPALTSHIPQHFKQQANINSQCQVISPPPAYFYKNMAQPSAIIPKNQVIYVPLDAHQSFSSANQVMLPQYKGSNPVSSLSQEGRKAIKKGQDKHPAKVKSKRLCYSKSEKSYLNKETKGILFDYSVPCSNCIKKGVINRYNSFAQQALAEINAVKEENKQLKLIINQLEISLKEVEENLR